MDAVLFEQDDASARGEAHGELWRDEIQTLAELRTQLALQRGAFVDRPQLLAIARLHLPLLARAAPEEHAELLGIARAAQVSPEAIVILNHYTDLRDVPPSVLDDAEARGEGDGAGEAPLGSPGAGDPGGCTALYVHGHAGAVLGQTWDMHGTAVDFVRMVRIRPAGSEREILTFTLTGCLGMTGLNEHGVAVTINNLTSSDARVGLVWPALVRRMLACESADAAREVLMQARLGSGHHYMIADGWAFHGVETSGRLKVQTQHGANTAHVHTNHCFDPVLRKHERVARESTTFRRMELATTAYVQQRPESADEVWSFLSSHEGYPRSICSHVEGENSDPSASRTCGLVVMSLAGGDVRVTRGCAHEGERRELHMTRWRGLPAVREPAHDEGAVSP